MGDKDENPERRKVRGIAARVVCLLNEVPFGKAMAGEDWVAEACAFVGLRRKAIVGPVSSLTCLLDTGLR